MNRDLLDLASLAAAQLNAAGIVHNRPVWVETASKLTRAVLQEVCGPTYTPPADDPQAAAGESVDEHTERVLAGIED